MTKSKRLRAFTLFVILMFAATASALAAPTDPHDPPPPPPDDPPDDPPEGENSIGIGSVTLQIGMLPSFFSIPLLGLF